MNIISLVASIITLVAVWSKISAMCYNIKHFRKGGLKLTFPSGAYQIMGDGGNGEVIFKYIPPNSEGFKSYATIGMTMRPSKIKPFLKWNMAHWADDIRTPNYPLELL